jgi:hypothetical protein
MIPLASTTVTVQRTRSLGDPYEPAQVDTIAAGVSAHISGPSGTDVRVGGQQEVVDAVLYVAASADVVRADQIADEVTGERWTVTWTRVRRGVGLDHRQAGLVAVKGAANG